MSRLYSRWLDSRWHAYALADEDGPVLIVHDSDWGGDAYRLTVTQAEALNTAESVRLWLKDQCRADATPMEIATLQQAIKSFLTDQNTSSLRLDCHHVAPV